MKTVWKYLLVPSEETVIPMPSMAMPLKVLVQGRGPVMWAAVDTESPLVDRRFRIYGTGQEIPDYHKLSYVDTFQLHDAFRGDLVFHVFEVVF